MALLPRHGPVPETRREIGGPAGRARRFIAGRPPGREVLCAGRADNLDAARVLRPSPTGAVPELARTGDCASRMTSARAEWRGLPMQERDVRGGLPDARDAPRSRCRGGLLERGADEQPCARLREVATRSGRIAMVPATGAGPVYRSDQMSRPDGESGGQGRNRTTDTRIFSPLLYQLSYLASNWKL